MLSGPEVIKLFLMFNSVEHEILNAHKYRKKKSAFYLNLECFFSPFINVKMPTIVGILTFMSRKKFMFN